MIFLSSSQFYVSANEILKHVLSNITRIVSETHSKCEKEGPINPRIQ